VADRAPCWAARLTGGPLGHRTGRASLAAAAHPHLFHFFTSFLSFLIFSGLVFHAIGYFFSLFSCENN
jgi:hypothetical protein